MSNESPDAAIEAEDTVAGRAQVGEASLHDAGDDSGAESRPHPDKLKLSKLARNHLLFFLLALSSFAAADSWNAVTGLGVAALLCLITAALAGITFTTLSHEWFHYLGARFAGARIDIPTREGLFIYSWDFGRNSVGQFLFMSIAGSVGGFLAVILLWTTVPADTLGRAVLRSAAIASVAYAAMIEWPVIGRTRRSGDPLTELSKIDRALLSRSMVIATAAGLALTLAFTR